MRGHLGNCEAPRGCKRLCEVPEVFGKLPKASRGFAKPQWASCIYTFHLSFPRDTEDFQGIRGCLVHF